MRSQPKQAADRHQLGRPAAIVHISERVLRSSRARYGARARHGHRRTATDPPLFDSVETLTPGHSVGGRRAGRPPFARRGRGHPAGRDPGRLRVRPIVRSVSKSTASGSPANACGNGDRHYDERPYGCAVAERIGIYILGDPRIDAHLAEWNFIHGAEYLEERQDAPIGTYELLGLSTSLRKLLFDKRALATRVPADRGLPAPQFEYTPYSEPRATVKTASLYLSFADESFRAPAIATNLALFLAAPCAHFDARSVSVLEALRTFAYVHGGVHDGRASDSLPGLYQDVRRVSRWSAMRMDRRHPAHFLCDDTGPPALGR